MNESSRNNLSQALNSPVLAVALLLIAMPFAWSLAESMAIKRKIRATASELQQTIAQLQNTNEAGFIKQLVMGSVTQVMDGFREGMNAGGADQNRKLAEFRRVRPLITLSELVKGPTQQASQEVWVGTIANRSDKPIKSLRLNALFYDDRDRLIDVKEAWLHNVNVLEPDESIGVKITRPLGRHDEDEQVLITRQAARIDCKITKFDVVEQ